MRLRLIAVGSRMPKWVEEGWHEYAKRLPSELALELVEVSLVTHPMQPLARVIGVEGGESEVGEGSAVMAGW